MGVSIIKRSIPDLIFDSINYLILTVVLIIVIYPLYFIIIASISNPSLVGSGDVWLFPRGINFDGYRSIFKDPIILTGYSNSIIYTLLGTSINMFVTISAAYSLSRKDLVGQNALMFLFTFTMFFSGGMIPGYLIVKNLKMINTIWAMVIPNALSVYNLIVCRTFFKTNIPDELFEAASIEGCSNIRFFLEMVIPLSKALLAVMVLFYGVSHWNSFFNGLIYLKDEKKYPLQLVLRNILLANMQRNAMLEGFADTNTSAQQKAELIKYGIIIVASVPVLMIYPFIQRFFIKGVMIGAIKG